MRFCFYHTHHAKHQLVVRHEIKTCRVWYANHSIRTAGHELLVGLVFRSDSTIGNIKEHSNMCVCDAEHICFVAKYVFFEFASKKDYRMLMTRWM